MFLVLYGIYVVIVNNAADLALASRADEVFCVYRLVKANGLTAGGADDLEIFLVIVAITATVAAVFALVAVAVAITLVAITAAIALVVLSLVDEVFLNSAEVLVKLVTVIVYVLNVSLKISDLCSHIVYKVNQCVDYLSLGGACVKLKAVAKSLDVSSFFGKCHFLCPRSFLDF